MKKKTNEETKNPSSHGAHSTVRSGGSDYNDGANVTDYLGNDDYEGDPAAFQSGSSQDEPIGKVAHGNNVEENQHMDDEDIVDEASEESFPASDPPGYRSKSSVDREEHERIGGVRHG